MGRWNTGQGLGAKEMIDTDKYETDNGSTLRIGLLRQDAELLFEEVKRLRKGIWDATYLFQEAGNPKMSDKKRLETICEFLVELIE